MYLDTLMSNCAHPRYFLPDIADLILMYLPKDQPLPWITPEMINLKMLTLNSAAVPFLLENPEHINPAYAWGNFGLTDFCMKKAALEGPKSKWFPSMYDPLLMLNPHPLAEYIVDKYAYDGWPGQPPSLSERCRRYMRLYSQAMSKVNYTRNGNDAFCARSDSIAYLREHPDEISERGFSLNQAIFDHPPELREFLTSIISVPDDCCD
jgi:hypothetical protein